MAQLRIALTGATGLLGRFIAQAALSAGHEVATLGRAPLATGIARLSHRPHDLGDRGPAPLRQGEVLVHAALAHLPGLYRGGEGTDAAGFVRLNLDGTRRLFADAAAAGVARIVFMSSRAVYDGLAGAQTEDRALEPDSLYGQVKLAAEQALRHCGVPGVALRATGIYGRPPSFSPAFTCDHKWQKMFDYFTSGRAILPRAATEVHGIDLASAVMLVAGGDDRWPVPNLSDPVLNLSDIVLDRHDLLGRVAVLTGCRHPLPDPAPAPAAYDSGRLRRLGWQPGGLARLDAVLPGLLAPAGR